MKSRTERLATWIVILSMLYLLAQIARFAL